LLQRGCVDHDVSVPHGSTDIAVVADVADPELQHVLEVLVDHLVRGRPPL
jgi:hypothetical protein